MPKVVRASDPAPGWEAFEWNNVEAATKARLESGMPDPRLAEPIRSTAFEEQTLDDVVKHLRRGGADYGDVRLGRDHQRVVATVDESLGAHSHRESTGLSVRALVQGFWGFAASSDLSPDGVRACVHEAIGLAKSLAQSMPHDLALPMNQWAAEPAHQAECHTPVGISPLTCSISAIAEPLMAGAAAARQRAEIRRVMGQAIIYGRRRYFASTEGANILTTHAVVDSMQRYVAVADGHSAYRTIVGAAMGGGLEHLHATDYPGRALSMADEAIAKCSAPTVDPGNYDLILDGHNLALTMHESVGHPTELDRVLGFELGFAGGSFAGLDKLGQFQYGSPIVNFTANNTMQFGCASVGFDDEGVECQKFPIIKEGQLVGFGSNRETAHKMGASRANGTCRATGWGDPPIVRIPNLYLEPGTNPLSLDDLIGGVDDGILMLGRDSFSIDQMRLNFQFGSDMAYRIEKGKVTTPLRDVIYQSKSTDFWRQCSAICDASEWQMHGVFNCGKGQPIQLAKMTHGAAPARFDQIRVGF